MNGKTTLILLTLNIMEVVALGGITAVIVGMVEIVKRVGMPSKFAGLLAVCLGVFAAISLSASQGSILWYESVRDGIIIGLTAAGVYSGSKAIIFNPPNSD